MKLIELNVANVLFDAGELKEATVVSALMESGYNLLIKGKQVKSYGIRAQRDRKALRAFKSIDAAVAMARKIGFKQIAVELD